MANSFNLTLDTKGVKALLNSKEVKNACISVAEEKRAQAGEQYFVKSGKYGDRVGAKVASSDIKEYFRNKNGNSVLKRTGLHPYNGKRGGK